MITPQQNQYGQAGTGGDAAHGSDLKGSARALGEQAKMEGKTRVEGARRTAADKVDTLADSAQVAAERLRNDDIGHLSDYVTDLANSMTRLSSSLREKSGDEVLREVGRLARENPALFVTGSVAVGFGLARFARASEKRRLQEESASTDLAREYPLPSDATGTARDTTAATGTVYTSAPGAGGGSGYGSTDGAGQTRPGAGQSDPDDTRGGIH